MTRSANLASFARTIDGAAAILLANTVTVGNSSVNTAHAATGFTLNSANVSFGSTGNNYIMTTVAGSQLALGTNNAIGLFMDGSQNVGIATTPNANTTSKLFVGGDITRTGASGGFLFNLQYSSTNSRWEYAGTGTGAGWVDSGSGNYTFQSTGSTSGTVGTAASTLTERIRIDSSGNLLVGLTSGSGKLSVKSTTSDITTFPFIAYNSTPASLFYVRSDGLVNTGSAAASPYNNTTASAANMAMDSGGTLYRSTSSLRYKTNVQDYEKGLADIMKLRPVTFNSKPKEGDETPDTTTYAGFIAEEVHEVGLTEFVQYNKDNEPDALAYANMVALLTKAIQELNDKFEAYKAAHP